jgi:hypothetical protein
MKGKKKEREKNRNFPAEKELSQKTLKRYGEENEEQQNSPRISNIAAEDLARRLHIVVAGLSAIVQQKRQNKRSTSLGNNRDFDSGSKNE